MLGPMLNTIHNLHFYVDLMRQIRQALDEDRFDAWRRSFASDRARGV
jgi:queuine tRNA-ribosyltransferase